MRFSLAELAVIRKQTKLRGFDGQRQIMSFVFVCTEAELVTTFLVTRMTFHVSEFVTVSPPNGAFHFSLQS